MIPDGWQIREFYDVASIKGGLVDPKLPPFCDYLHVGPEDIYGTSGMIIGPLSTAAEIGLISGKFEFSEGDILYSKIRPNLNKVARAGHSGLCSADMYVVTAVDNESDTAFLYHLLRGEEFYKQAVAGSMRSGLPKVNREDLGLIDLSMPPLFEQRRIAAVLDEWDTAITTAEKLLEAKEKKQVELRKRLLTGNLRLPGFNYNWEWVVFSEVFERVRQKNDIGNTNVLTISAQKGLVSQLDYFNKSVSSEDVRGYTLVQRGDFAYNKSYSDGYPMGALKPLEAYEYGVVSSLYICFRLVSEHHNHTFLKHYFDAGAFNEEIAGIAQEGARNHGLLNVSVVEFFETGLFVPGRDEQDAIAFVLDSIADDLTVERERLALLRSQKRGLMQKLLTGQWRVPESINALLPEAVAI